MSAMTIQRKSFDRDADNEAACAGFSLTAYYRDMGRIRLPGHEEQLALSRRAKKGDSEARAAMIEGNLRLVAMVAKRYAGRGMDLSDLIAEGNVGLVHAVDKFDPEKGFRFATYAVNWISQAIERAIITKSQTIKIPHHVYWDMHKADGAKRRLLLRHQKPPTAEAVAVECGLDVNRVVELGRFRSVVLSLDASQGNDDGPDFYAIIADEDAEPADEKIIRDEELSRLWRSLANLSKREREIIALRFGLREEEALSLEEVGRRFGLTRERVRQLQLRALSLMRRELEGARGMRPGSVGAA